MPRVALSADEIAAFRGKAIHVATKLFAEQGYQAVTMRAIADALGISAMAPYRYFENKAEIFALVRAEATRAFNECLRRELERDAPVFERLIRVREAYVRFALGHPDQYRIIFEQRSESDDAYPELAEASLSGMELMLRCGQLAIEAGLYTGDPVTVAHLLWVHVHGLVSLHHAGKLQAGRTLEQLLDLSTARIADIAAHAAPTKRRSKARKRRGKP
ncbi:MAG TPA: TetR/AcrR family transcriptional regulator [Polyangiales bacterium]|nr:TetR/AcrR family transcriptional regulator [Polyangiales bacterium]